MFCKNCGADIPEGSAFCGNCGMKVEAQPAQPEQPVQPEQPAQPEQPQYTQPEANQQYSGQQDTYQSYQQQAQYQQAQPQYAPPVYNAQPVQPEALPNPTLWIILNIIMIVLGCCCTFSGIAGIIGLVFAIQGSNAVKAGDFATAQSKLKTAKILFFVSLGLFVVGNILGIVTGLFSDYLAQLEDYMYYM